VPYLTTVPAGGRTTLAKLPGNVVPRVPADFPVRVPFWYGARTARGGATPLASGAITHVAATLASAACR
jgi:hypothetical protein